MVEFDGNVRRPNGRQPARDGSAQEPISAEIAKKILIDFKKKDADQTMRVSFEELSNAIIKEYVANGYQRNDTHNQGETITDLLNYYQERAKEFDVNGDGQLNIDEYTTMFREKFEQAEREAEQQHGEASEHNTAPPEESGYTPASARPQNVNHPKDQGEVKAPENRDEGATVNPPAPAKKDEEQTSRLLEAGKNILGFGIVGAVAKAVSEGIKDTPETPAEE